MKNSVHWHLYAEPNAISEADEAIELLSLEQQASYTLPKLERVDVATSFYTKSFETVAENLQANSAIYFDWDGAFWWTGPGGTWQLDGMLYDVGGRLQRVELKGWFPRNAWDQVLKSLGFPDESIVVHLVDRGAFVRASQIR